MNGKDRKVRLPFNKGFIGGILIVVAARALETDWLLYCGIVVGGALCVRAVFRALKDM